jgi:EmrB/QacA subfamily drug resistance transporter
MTADVVLAPKVNLTATDSTADHVNGGYSAATMLELGVAMDRNMGSRRWWAAGALALSGVVIGVDATVLSLALPTLATDLHASTAQLQWFVDAYLLVLGALMLPAGLLGDRFGRKRLLLVALCLFGIGSLACAYSTSAAELIAARSLLGLAAAFILPLSFAVLPVLFAEHERQRALAVVAGSALASYPLGPIVGGWLLTNFWWGSVFLVNVPVIVLALLAVTFLMPESKSPHRPRLDPVGVVLSTAGLVALTYGVIKAGSDGWGSRVPTLSIVAGAIVLGGFVWWQRWLGRRPSGQPLVDLGLFRSRGFAWGTILSTLLSFSLIGLLFVVPQYLRAVLGLDAMGAGLRLLPMFAGMVVGLAVGDRISRVAGPRIAVAIGFAVAACGLLVGAFTSTHDGTGFAAVWLAITGVGTGVALPPSLNAALGQLSGESSGVGSALITAIRQVGGTFGVAVLGSVLNSAYRGQLHLPELPSQAGEAIRDNVAAGVVVARQLRSEDLLAMIQSAFIHGMDVLLGLSSGIAFAGALLAIVFLPGGAGRGRGAPAPAPETVEASAVGVPAVDGG